MAKASASPTDYGVCGFIELDELPDGVSLEEAERLVEAFDAISHHYYRPELDGEYDMRAEDAELSAELALCKAVRRGELRLDVAYGTEQATLLQHAIANDMPNLALEILHRLEDEHLQHTINYQTGREKLSAVFLAIRHTMPEVLEAMCETGGVDLKARNAMNENLIASAVSPGRLEMVSYLMDVGVSTVDVNQDGDNLLHLLVRDSRIDIRYDPAKAIVDRMVSRLGVDAVNGHHTSPLGVALGDEESTDKAQWLISRYGASLKKAADSVNMHLPDNFDLREVNALVDRIEALDASDAEKHSYLKGLHHALCKRGFFTNMIEEFSEVVILPAILKEMGYPEDPITKDMVDRNEMPFCASQDRADRWKELTGMLQELRGDLIDVITPSPADLPPEEDRVGRYEYRRQVIRQLELSNTWSHETVQIPEKLRPLRPYYEWVPLFPALFPPAGTQGMHGMSIYCMRNTADVEEEARAMKHCIVRQHYDGKCALAEAHLLSIRDANGKHISTVEIEIEDYNQEPPIDFATLRARDGYLVPIPRLGICLRVNQHDGVGGQNQHPGPLAESALRHFLREVQRDPMSYLNYQYIQRELMGETRSSLERRSGGNLYKDMCEYDPIRWETINERFDEYRLPYRRGGYFSTVRRVYEDGICADDPQAFPHSNHFIQGYVRRSDAEQGTRIPPIAISVSQRGGDEDINLRTLDVRGFLRATGLMTRIHEVITRYAPEIAQRRQAQWKEDARQPLQTRELPQTDRIEEWRESARRAEVGRQIESASHCGTFTHGANRNPDV